MKLNLFKLFTFIITGIALILFVVNVVHYFAWEGMDTPEVLENCVYSFLLVVMVAIPDMLAKRFRVSLPLVFVWDLFWAMQLLLGSIGNLYVTTDFWDVIMHSFAILMLQLIGFELLKFTNLKKEFTIKQKILMICAFAFAMAIAWELGEFVLDRMYDLNLQRYRNEITNVPYTGFAKFADTVKDLIVDIVSIAIYGFIRYYDLSRKNKISNLFTIEKKPFSGKKKAITEV